LLNPEGGAEPIESPDISPNKTLQLKGSKNRLKARERKGNNGVLGKAGMTTKRNGPFEQKIRKRSHGSNAIGGPSPCAGSLKTAKTAGEMEWGSLSLWFALKTPSWVEGKGGGVTLQKIKADSGLVKMCPRRGKEEEARLHYIRAKKAFIDAGGLENL